MQTRWDPKRALGSVRPRAVKRAAFGVLATGLLLGAAGPVQVAILHGRGAGRNLPPPTTLSVPAVPPPGGRGLLGTVLTGVGAHLERPLSPSYAPYRPNCQYLIDPGFSGKCIVAASSKGAAAGVVEVESATGSRVRQERDLVWVRNGQRWALAEVHVASVCLDGKNCDASPGLPALLWRDDLARSGNPDLVLVMPSDRPGFGSELDVVAVTGVVVLYRDLGGGFALVPPSGGLVAYVPGASEAAPADSYFDQVLVRFEGGRWRLISDQYVPYSAAIDQHQGVFYDPQAVPAA